MKSRACSVSCVAIPFIRPILRRMILMNGICLETQSSFLSHSHASWSRNKACVFSRVCSRVPSQHNKLTSWNSSSVLYFIVLLLNRSASRVRIVSQRGWVFFCRTSAIRYHGVTKNGYPYVDAHEYASARNFPPLPDKHGSRFWEKFTKCICGQGAHSFLYYAIHHSPASTTTLVRKSNDWERGINRPTSFC